MVQSRTTHFVQALDLGSNALSFNSLPLDYFAPGPGVLYGRNQWGTGATLYHLILGQDGYENGHDHMDWGFQLWRNGRWLSRETTGYSGTILGYAGTGSASTNSVLSHNGILMNGSGSLAGEDYHEGPPQILRLESRPEYSFVAVNLGPAYRAPLRPQNDNPAVANMVREFIFIRPLETMIIFDRLESNTVGNITASDITKTFLAHFETSPTIDEINHIVTSINGTESLRIKTLIPSNPSYRVITEGGTYGQYRLELETSGTAQSYFLNVLQAKGASDPNLTSSVVDDSSSYTVTLTHPTRGNVTIVFNKGMSSAGGSIYVGGQSYNLNNTIQSISVTDSGPAWGSLAGGVSAPPPIIPPVTTPTSTTSPTQTQTPTQTPTTSSGGGTSPNSTPIQTSTQTGTGGNVAGTTGNLTVSTVSSPSTSTTSTTPLTRTLYAGMVGTDVTILQNHLISLGYLTAGNNDGNFGPLTRSAVQKYQCDKLQICSGGESTTGWGTVGQRTRALLNATQNSTSTPITSIQSIKLTRTLYKGIKGNDVAVLQSYLINLGYLAKGNNTGFFGNLTRSAVQEYQCDKMQICSGSESSTGWGKVGPRTRNTMSK